jgi:nitrogen PTS system EIIA component
VDTVLDALQGGRLFELPDHDKGHVLQFLAHIVEAFPEVPAGTDVLGAIMKKEEATNSSIGGGLACPHARVSFDEDLMCAIGWSPKEIDYGARDGKPVTLVIMHLVPENQRANYLREVSIIAKAIENLPSTEQLRDVKDLNDVRSYLLDLIEVSKEPTGPDTRARMVRLQAKPQVAAIRDLSNLVVEPVTLVAGPGVQPVALTQNSSLMELLDSTPDLIEKIEASGVFQGKGWRIVRRGAVHYIGSRVAYDCLAIGINGH